MRDRDIPPHWIPGQEALDRVVAAYLQQCEEMCHPLGDGETASMPTNLKSGVSQWTE